MPQLLSVLKIFAKRLAKVLPIGLLPCSQISEV